ncbi:P-type conjugative transfer protein TrbG [Solidesulfovibrio carbinoliphilus subsp. oakridgensis]|uniref:P-type conjugative transfer protein TrbG n=1 Tax=Solidesulfovibrio carbinoliphilus subsp. oakridgensis TaxID=694327 RepID=G7QB67_9BACT|nr:P-type conjugative transfer protein TrbG [Solidesulfovibrio carbinoliphilus]EHJ48809.1 P-type conjugative transfer protein TrbG [Solidesulfovibrio carbinoliphilus subsp. oakridgensis]
MNRMLLTVSGLLTLLAFLVSPGWADDKGKGWVPEDYKMDAMGSEAKPGKPLAPLSPMAVFGPNSNAPLTARDRQAVQLARDWENTGPAPIQANGKVMFVFGALTPTIIGAPLQICDVELQPGESVNEVVVGDSARWMLEVAKSGTTTHILIKPVDAGLSTSAVITTDRRAYHLSLKSQRTDHTPHIAFLYPGDGAARLREKEAKDAKEKEFKTADVDGQPTDLSKLNFGYEINGDAPWKPLQVFDDGRQMFIKLPPAVQSGDAPVVLVRNGGQDTLANFRMKNLTLLVDGVFPEAKLISGVGSKQQRITIRKAQ